MQTSRRLATLNSQPVTDPYFLADLTSLGKVPCVPNSAASARTAVSPTLVGGETTGVIIGIGQSNICNQVNAQYAPFNAKVHNFNIGDGRCYAAQDPLLGCAVPDSTGGNWLTRLGDKLITAGKYQRVILVPIGVGHTRVDEWAAGGVFNHRIGVTLRRLELVGLKPSHIIWHQGESDTLAATTAANYTASLRSVIDTFRTDGCIAPFHIGQVSYISGAPANSVRIGQQNAVDNSAPPRSYLGPDSDAFTTTAYRQSDLTHFNATGANACASAWSAYIAEFTPKHA